MHVQACRPSNLLAAFSLRTALATAAFLCVSPIAMLAQPDAPGTPLLQARAVTPELLTDATVSSSSASTELPESPGTVEAEAMAVAPQAHTSAIPGNTTSPNAGTGQVVVLPGQTAARMTVGNKISQGIRENLTLTSAAGWLISAGYEQAVDGSPNYGQTGKGFAQRLGAAAARGASENIFSDSVLAPILHEDPRYYKMGPGHNFFARVVYAGTRPLITRTDGGRLTPNFSHLGGNLSASALTQVYYPPLNRGFNQVLQTFGGAEGGDALSYLADEFLSGLLHTVYHRNPR